MSILRILQDVDDATGRFQEATGLTCPTGCGACCENARVETTVAECLPLAEHLQQTGHATGTHQRAVDGKGAWCIFYEQQSPGMGRCGVYAWRPGICRLFGFAGVRRKQTVELATCWHHRETQPQRVDLAEAGAFEMPVFSDVERRVAQAHPELGRTRMPINDAWAAALETVTRCR